MTSVWTQLVGQEPAVEILRTAAAAAAEIAAGRSGPAGAMTHAWLFTGPPGSGRSVAARAFAAALQCERDGELGCGECSACRTVSARTHPDVHSVVPEGLSIGVNEMRAVVGRAARRPSLGRWQVVVIEDADRLTEQASNALLKAVEEPPARTVFLLCAPSLHPDDVSVTIRSRCRLVSLRTPPAEAVAGVLRADGIDGATAAWAAAAGQGHVGRSRRLARDADARGAAGRGAGDPRLAHLAAGMPRRRRPSRRGGRARGDGAVGRTRRGRDRRRCRWRSAPGRRARAWPRRCAARPARSRTSRSGRSPARPGRSATRWTARLSTSPRSTATSCSGTPARASCRRTRTSPTTSRRWRCGSMPPGRCAGSTSILACRQALELNVKPRIAVEALTAALRLPA